MKTLAKSLKSFKRNEKRTLLYKKEYYSIVK